MLAAIELQTGRRLWEQPEEKKDNEIAEPSSPDEALPQSKDPTGGKGGVLDISG